MSVHPSASLISATCNLVYIKFIKVDGGWRLKITDGIFWSHDTYEGWNYNSGNYLFTTDTKYE